MIDLFTRPDTSKLFEDALDTSDRRVEQSGAAEQRRHAGPPSQGGAGLQLDRGVHPAGTPSLPAPVVVGLGAHRHSLLPLRSAARHARAQAPLRSPVAEWSLATAGLQPPLHELLPGPQFLAR